MRRAVSLEGESTAGGKPRRRVTLVPLDTQRPVRRARVPETDALRVLVISGMWPPDVGGPASHAPEVAAYLRSRGHDVSAVTMADAAPPAEPCPVHWASRRRPIGWRHVAATRAVVTRARRADVVYSTGMVGRSALGTALAGTPIVMKLTSDPVFERSLRWGLWTADLEGFQRARGLRIDMLRRARDLELGRATRLITPSQALRNLAITWGVPEEKLVVIPNPVSAPTVDDRETLRERHGLSGRTLVFAGRLVPQKALDVAFEAVRANPDVSLIIAGDGPWRERLQRNAAALSLNGQARFLGPQPRQTVFELLHAADAALLPSSWENSPHVVVEALSVGTPVIATDAGGVKEILRDEENGLLVPINDADALAGAIRRYFDDPELEERLRVGTRGAVDHLAPSVIYRRLEQVLTDAATSG